MGRSTRKRDSMEKRVIAVAQYMIDNKSTVRSAAKVFGVSKCTIHEDCTRRLIEYRYSELAAEVRKVIDTNKQERAIRGAIATRNIYLNKKGIT